VIITGHSLGGAIAGLLCHLFTSKGRSCKAYVFGPGVNTKFLQNSFVQSNVLAFVNRTDVVPRLSLGAVEKMFQVKSSNICASSSKSSDEKSLDNIFYPAGRLYLLRNGGVHKLNAASLNLLVSPNMLKDHELDSYIRTLKKLSDCNKPQL